MCPWVHVLEIYVPKFLQKNVNKSRCLWRHYGICHQFSGQNPTKNIIRIATHLKRVWKISWKIPWLFPISIEKWHFEWVLEQNSQSGHQFEYNKLLFMESQTIALIKLIQYWYNAKAFVGTSSGNMKYLARFTF